MKSKAQSLIALLSLVLCTSMNAQSIDTVERIKATGAVTLGVRDSSGPLAYVLPGGQYVGFHTEMAERIVADMQASLGLSSLTIRRQPVSSQNRIPLVQNGTVDLECGSTTNTSARKREVAFAHTTYVEEVRIAVRAGSGINSISGLNGKTVATTTGTTSVQLLRRNERAKSIDFREVMGQDHLESFHLLETGAADAFVMDTQILAGNILRSSTPHAFKIVGEPLSVEPIACMLRKDDLRFLSLVNKSIERQINDGSLARLYAKWFQQPIPPADIQINLPLSEATRAAWNSPNNRPVEDFRR